MAFTAEELATQGKNFLAGDTFVHFNPWPGCFFRQQEDQTRFNPFLGLQILKLSDREPLGVILPWDMAVTPGEDAHVNIARCHIDETTLYWTPIFSHVVLH